MNEPTPRRVLPVVIGIAATMLFLLLLGYLVQRRAREEATVPSLTVLAPSEQAFVDSPLVVRFRSTRPLGLTSAGWGTGQLHLHAWVNGVQIMPAAADIRSDQTGAYEWVVNQATRGRTQLWLGWADAAHRAITAGSSPSTSVTIR
jgi:hypothetical protein